MTRSDDPFIDRMVAIKTHLTKTSKDPKNPERNKQLFFNEARAAGKLTHPHIVSVYDAMWADDACYLIMEYVEGVTLKDSCSEENLLPFDLVLKFSFQCAKALDYAHHFGVIHRDIKPSNIMISTDNEVKISDFGISYMEGATDFEGSDSLTGSASYTSPEQLGHDPLKPQTDIFSLGVVMYELLTGINPFKDDSDVATIYNIVNKAPDPMVTHRKDIPESLERIVMRALEKDLSKRYQSCLQLASDLSSSFDGLRFSDEEINSKEKLNALKKLHFFKEFNSNELIEVLDNTQWLKYNASETVITEGEIEECFYIIVAGEVGVLKEDKQLAVLKQGDCFGEMAYLGKTIRTATIQAITKIILMKINATVIEQTSIATQLCFYKVFSKTLILRLSRTSELLSKVH